MKTTTNNLNVRARMMIVGAFAYGAGVQAAPPVNDTCDAAETVSNGVSGIAVNCEASTGIDDPIPSCMFGTNYGSVFFEFVATQTSARIRTDLNSVAGDSEFAIFAVDDFAPCDTSIWSEVACVEDGDFEFNGDTCVDGLIPGDTYKIMLVSFTSASCGEYTVDIVSPCSGAPVDNCPNDPNKTEPGLCGCGIPDTDTDTDGTPDCLDQCPNDPNKTEPGLCGCADNPVNCDDGNLCTVDNCDEVLGCWSDGTGITDVCDDGNGCTTGDACLGDSDGTCAGSFACDVNASCVELGGALSGCECNVGYIGNGLTCDEDCGDGFIVGTETCDDGNADPGDGCSAQCIVEEGFVCEGEPSVCTPDSPDAPLFELGGGLKNRYLSFNGGNAGQRTAVRLTFADLPMPYDVWNGITMWVGEPREVGENGGNPAPTPGSPTFLAAELTCEPFYADWSAYGTVYTYHEGIVPDGLFELQSIDEGVAITQESRYSERLELATTIWGDTVLDCTVDPCPEADGQVNIVDVVAVLMKFANIDGAVIKARADLEPATPDQTVNISDVMAALSGFRSQSYPFEPSDIPCVGALLGQVNGDTDGDGETPSPSPIGISDKGYPVRGNSDRLGNATVTLAPSRDWELRIDDDTDRVDSALITFVPARDWVLPGDTVTVDVFVENVLDLRLFQVTSAVMSGDEGGLILEDLWIDVERDDYVFANLPAFDAADPIGGRFAAVLVSGYVEAIDRVYLGTFNLRASDDAGGPYHVGADLRESASFLWTSSNEPMRLEVHTAEVIITTSPRIDKAGR